MLDAFIGRLRAPHYAQITLDSRTGKLVMSFRGQSESGAQVEYKREYDSPLITGQAVSDLLSWLRQTARKFWGSDSGGL